MKDSTPEQMGAIEKQYVVIFLDRFDPESISFVLGPFNGLAAAHEGVNKAMERMDASYRQYSIQDCRTLAQIPEWEIAA